METKMIRGGVIALAIGFSCFLFMTSGAPQPTQGVPNYKVDPSWPKPMPNKWIMQGVPDLVVDNNDHIWVMNRPQTSCPMNRARRPIHLARTAARQLQRYWNSTQRET